MHKVFQCLLLITLFSSFSAQAAFEQSEPKHKGLITSHQIGINIAPFVDRFLKFNNTTNNIVVPYLFSYRMQLKQRSVIRLGLGVDMQNDEINSSSASNPRTMKSNSLNIGLGYEYYLLNLHRWKAGAGIQGFIQKVNTNSKETDFQGNQFILNNEAFTWGAGPALSIQYFISKNVCLGTEGAMYFSTSKSENETRVTGNFPQYTYEKSSSTNISPQFPISLFINFNF
ncbi:MAG: outer membrane beta-barrel protein [Bacteroidetes bacterium]|nr:outer membrane beta-barrel protein [Bacteroidota bacterium]